jgi:hypothetical protein
MKWAIILILLALSAIMIAGKVCLAPRETNVVTCLAPRQTRLPDSSVKVPFRAQGNFSVVEVMINNQGPFLFEVDTGCGSTMVSKDLVKRLRLPQCRGNVRIADASGRSHEYDVVQIRSLCLGKAEFQELYAEVTDLHVLSEGNHPVPDGLLGFDLFKDLLLTVDYPRQQVVLEKGRLSKPDDQDFLPIHMSGGMPYCTIEIGQKKIEVAIDTGCIGTFLFPEFLAKSLPLYNGRKVTWARDLSGLNHGVTARLVGKVRIGRHVLSEPFITWNTGVPGQSLLGTEVLKHLVITFDQAENTVRFSRNSGAIIQFPRMRSLGLVFIMEKGLLKINGIKPGTPAEKLDLKIGDQLVAADGLPAGKLDNARLLAIINQRDKINLKFKRAKKIFNVVVPIDQF